jgi:hypothetical protein
MLGTSLPEFLPAERRAHQGAGVEFHITVPAAGIGAVYEAHRRYADSVTELAGQPWDARAFHAVLLGYRFLIAAGGLVQPWAGARSTPNSESRPIDPGGGRPRD